MYTRLNTFISEGDGTVIVAATGNAGKMKEFRRILPDYEILSMKEAGFSGDVEENGKTFEENALLKARTVMEATGHAAFADDSGLVVDALDGAPGIYSARYAGEGASDAQLIEKLLKEMQGIPATERGAAFVSVIAYVSPDGEEKTFRGECRGRIDFVPRGENGFGYDPVFLIPEKGKTFGELSADEKNEISHRARALALFKTYMEKR
ncbi:MAG: XTP/dITP diphosphatase [Ruminococcaceae bacterium]|nr:XTP/dITP diphosphatase [Oscillospiraceae bacterium]